MTVKWIYQRMGDSLGPIDSSELKVLVAKGIVVPDTVIRRLSDAGNSDWVVASSIKSLFPTNQSNLTKHQNVFESHTAPPIPDPEKVRGNRFFVSSSGITEAYSTIDMVVGFASMQEGCGGNIKVEKAYNNALQRLVESAKSMKANAVIGVNFQNRVASSAGCGGNSQVFEVFAWGTAVTYYKKP